MSIVQAGMSSKQKLLCSFCTGRRLLVCRPKWLIQFRCPTHELTIITVSWATTFWFSEEITAKVVFQRIFLFLLCHWPQHLACIQTCSFNGINIYCWPQCTMLERIKNKALQSESKVTCMFPVSDASFGHSSQKMHRQFATKYTHTGTHAHRHKKLKSTSLSCFSRE